MRRETFLVPTVRNLTFQEMKLQRKENLFIEKQNLEMIKVGRLLISEKRYLKREERWHKEMSETFCPKNSL